MITSSVATIIQAVSPLSNFMGVAGGRSGVRCAASAAAGCRPQDAAADHGRGGIGDRNSRSRRDPGPRPARAGSHPGPGRQVVFSFFRSPGASERGLTGLAGADADDLLERLHEDLAVADLAGAGRLLDGPRRPGRRRRRPPRLRSSPWAGSRRRTRRRGRARYGPFCRPKPLTSVTVRPWMPMADSASRTSSSLNGLMTAVMSFMRASPA